LSDTSRPAGWPTKSVAEEAPAGAACDMVGARATPREAMTSFALLTTSDGGSGATRKGIHRYRCTDAVANKNKNVNHKWGQLSRKSEASFADGFSTRSARSREKGSEMLKHWEYTKDQTKGG
jgi:hypothetical protein